MIVNIQTRTDGTSLWAHGLMENVTIRRLEIGYLADDKNFGELRAYFDPKQWDCFELGLIYTDEGWMECLKKELAKIGFSKISIDGLSYSEQGMQGDDYVSMDFDGPFYSEWIKINNVEA